MKQFTDVQNVPQKKNPKMLLTIWLKRNGDGRNLSKLKTDEKSQQSRTNQITSHY